MRILIDDEQKSNIVEWCTYKYLLDLPGAHPWSVRLKELFLTKSLVIHVAVKSEKISQFISEAFIPGVDYAEVIFNPDYNVKKGKHASAEQYLVYQILEKRKKYNNDTEAYQRIVVSAYNKIILLEYNNILYYLHLLLTEYVKKFLLINLFILIFLK